MLRSPMRSIASRRPVRSLLAARSGWWGTSGSWASMWGVHGKCSVGRKERTGYSNGFPNDYSRAAAGELYQEWNGSGIGQAGGRRFAVDEFGVGVPSMVVEARVLTEAEGSNDDMTRQ